jgi:hypothetical protein
MPETRGKTLEQIEAAFGAAPLDAVVHHRTEGDGESWDRAEKGEDRQIEESV